MSYRPPPFAADAIGHRVRIGVNEGQLTKVLLETGEFTVGARAYPGMEWGNVVLIADPPKDCFVARTDKVAMVVSRAEYEILAQAGATVKPGEG